MALTILDTKRFFREGNAGVKTKDWREIKDLMSEDVCFFSQMNVWGRLVREGLMLKEGCKCENVKGFV